MKIKKRQHGFTIVELMCVIVVIAILAAVTIVAYNGVQSRARDAEVKSGVGRAKEKLDVYLINNKFYPATGDLAAAGVTNGNVAYQYTQTGGGSGFCLTGTKAGIAATVTEAESASPTTGTCSGHGTNGLPAVPPNMIANPSFETDTSGWVEDTIATNTIARVTGGSGIVSGSAAMEVTDISSSQPSSISYQISGLSASTTYTASLYLYIVNKGPSNWISLSVFTSGGGNCYQEIGLVTGASPRMTCTWTTSASPGTTSLTVAEQDPSGAGLKFRMDGVMIEAGSTLNAYHD